MIYRIDHERLDEMLRKIARHYGKEHQTQKLLEEIGEFLTALSRYRQQPSDRHYSELVSETADVFNVLHQFMLLYGIKMQVEAVQENKALRQIALMKLEKSPYVQ